MILQTTPLDGYIIEPEESWINNAASIICGHSFVDERLFKNEQDEFEAFIREVLRTTAPPRKVLRGRDLDLIALDAAHKIEALPTDLHEAQKTARIQLIVLDTLSSQNKEAI
jgi:hypothetical protein